MPKTIKKSRIMPIISSEVVINHAEEDEYHRRIRELHTDQTGVVTPVNYKAVFNEAGNIIDDEGTILFNTLADKTAADADMVQGNLAEQEIQEWISEMKAGGDPAHIDMGGWFEHSVPEFNTWEDALDGSLTPILQTAYMQDILICKLTCDRLTKKELEEVAGKNNDVLGEQAIASNTQVEFDSYIPLIDEEGNPRG